MTFMPNLNEEQRQKLYTDTVSGTCSTHNCPIVRFESFEQCLVDWLIQNLMGQRLVDVVLPDALGGLELVHINGFALPGLNVYNGKRLIESEKILAVISGLNANGMKYNFSVEEKNTYRIDYTSNQPGNKKVISVTCSELDLVLRWYWTTMDRVIPD